jgi:hypothetical protein
LRNVGLALVVLAVAGAGCIRTITPARTFDAYEHKAKNTAESVLSSVQTARLGARAASDGDAFGPHVSVLLSEAEVDASKAHATFDTIQPPDDHGDALRDRLGRLLNRADAFVTRHE